MGKAQPDAKWDYCAEQERGDKFPKLRVIAASFEGQSPEAGKLKSPPPTP
jgi:hypothetical protein